MPLQKKRKKSCFWIYVKYVFSNYDAIPVAQLSLPQYWMKINIIILVWKIAIHGNALLLRDLSWYI